VLFLVLFLVLVFAVLVLLVLVLIVLLYDIVARLPLLVAHRTLLCSSFVQIRAPRTIPSWWYWCALCFDAAVSPASSNAWRGAWGFEGGTGSAGLAHRTSHAFASKPFVDGRARFARPRVRLYGGVELMVEQPEISYLQQRVLDRLAHSRQIFRRAAQRTRVQRGSNGVVAQHTGRFGVLLSGGGGGGVGGGVGGGGIGGTCDI
jgi:hypothetical protein